MTEPSAQLEKLLAESGLNSDELLAALNVRSSRPLVKDHVAKYLKRQTEGTRRGYATHLNRLVKGYGAVCDQTCEPCLDITGDQPLKCNCTCRACISSRITVQPRGDEHVGPTVNRCNFRRQGSHLVAVQGLDEEDIQRRLLSSDATLRAAAQSMDSIPSDFTDLLQYLGRVVGRSAG